MAFIHCIVHLMYISPKSTISLVTINMLSYLGLQLWIINFYVTTVLRVWYEVQGYISCPKLIANFLNASIILFAFIIWFEFIGGGIGGLVFVVLFVLVFSR